MPPSWPMSEYSEILITLQRPLEGLEYCFHTHLFQLVLLHYYPQQQNNFPSCWGKVCILWHMHSGSWLNRRINEKLKWDSYFFLVWTMLLLNARSKLSWERRIHMEINTIKLKRSSLFLTLDTYAQWGRWDINRDISGLCFLCNLFCLWHQYRSAAWQLVLLLLMLFDTWQKWKMWTEHFHGLAGEFISQRDSVYLVSMDIRGLHRKDDGGLSMWALPEIKHSRNIGYGGV